MRPQQPNTFDRFDRAGTLCLASLALGVGVWLGWGGPILDLRVLSDPLGGVLTAIGQGQPVGLSMMGGLRNLSAEDLWAVVGTSATLLLGWHLISLSAELVLLAAQSLGWLQQRALRPIWRFLDVLDSGPLARPKRIVVAGALAGQLLVRAGGPVHAAPAAWTPVVLEINPAAIPPAPPFEIYHAPPVSADPAGSTLTHRVVHGDTLTGLAVRYYGDANHWVTLFDANAGTLMGYGGPRGSLPIRLVNPNYLLTGWDLTVPAVPTHLEQGTAGELIYVVRSGDTLSGIAGRFGVDLADLWRVNEGASAPNGRVLADPDLIWPGLRLQITPLGDVAESVDGPRSDTAESAPDLDLEVRAPDPTVPVPMPTAPLPTMPAAPRDGAPASAPPVVAQPAADVVPPPPSNPRGDEFPAGLRHAGPLVATAAGIVAAGLLWRRRRRPFVSDLTFDRTRVQASPSRVLEQHRLGDPAELAAAAVLASVAAHTAAARIVAVYRDPNEVTVVLATAAAERERVRTLLPAATQHLARRVTVWPTADRDLAVRLEGLNPAAVAPFGEEVPLLLSLGGLGDGREVLAGADTLGHLLIVAGAQPRDAEVQLRATATMLAASLGPDEVWFYTAAAPSSALTGLRALPHQQVFADSPEATHEMLEALRRTLEAARGDPTSACERVLLLDDLGTLSSDDHITLQRLLELGTECRLRVLAASADAAVATTLGSWLGSRMVFALASADESVALLGSPAAAELPDDGSMLIRLAGRVELIDALQLVVPDEELTTLLTQMRTSGEPTPRAEAVAVSPLPSEPPAPEAIAAESLATAPVGSTPARDVQPPSAEAEQDTENPSLDDIPPHIAALLASAKPDQLVLQCMGGLGLWCRDATGDVRFVGPGTGPGQLALTRQLDLLAYVAVRMTEHHAVVSGGEIGVSEADARLDLWHDGVSKQIVGITARRLATDLAKVGVTTRRSPLRVEQSRIRIDDEVCVVDCHQFLRVLDHARRQRGAAGLIHAEVAVAAYGGPLLEASVDEIADPSAGSREGSPTLVEEAPRTGRPASGPLLGWTQELAALGIAGKLVAAYRDALGLLAASLLEAGQVEQARVRAWEALRCGEVVPADSAARLARMILDATVRHGDHDRTTREARKLEAFFADAGLDVPSSLAEYSQTAVVAEPEPSATRAPASVR